MRLRSVLAVLLLPIATAVCSAQLATRGVAPNQSYVQSPLIFEINRGQADPQVRFLSRGQGYSAFLTAGSIVLSLHSTEGTLTSATPIVHGSSSGPSVVSLQFKLVGAAPNPEIVGENPQPGRANYFIGNDRSKWRTNVPTYGRVRYKAVYPGIDLVYYGHNRQLEYDFDVSPGGDPRVIQFEIEGARQTTLDSNGNLILETSAGELHFQSPTVYQESDGSRLPLQGGYVLTDSKHVGFRVTRPDPSQRLVIDPTLVYSSYVGGSGVDHPTGVAVDNAGNLYVAGYTTSTDFPLAAFGSLAAGSPHVFLAKFDPTGSNLLYADYIGGNSDDYGYAIALGGANEVYIAGSTASNNFPVVNAYQATYPGSFNAFLTKISSDGSSLLYSTYLGGNGADIPTSIALDASTDIFIAGNTSSTNFPVANAYQSTASPNQGGNYGTYGFLTEFTPDGSSLVYSTYLAGNSGVPYCGGAACWGQPYNTIQSLSLDGSGNAYVAGTTNAYNFPVTPGTYQTADYTQLNGYVGFVSKFSASGTLDYSTYFYEPTGFTFVDAIAVDNSGSAYISGASFSNSSFPLTSTSICDPAVYGTACSYTFVAKFDASASTLLYSTFLGPNNSGIPVAMALDQNNDAYVLANTTSSSFAEVNGVEAYSGGNEVLLTEIDPVAGSELFATYLGGTLDETATGMSQDSSGNIYITGTTTSTDFPTTQKAFQNQLDGNTDGFIMKIGTASSPSVSLTPQGLQYASLQVGSTSQSQQVLLRNMGSAALTLMSVSVVGDFAETDNCGKALNAASSCSLSVTFTPTASGPRTGSLIITDDAPGSPHTVVLSGTGIATPGAGLSPTSLAFPSTPLGASSAVQTVTLLSQGSASLNISNVQITGDYGQTNNCPSSLPAGANCVFNITFTPTTSGTRSGTLTISDNAPGGVQVVGLTGSGSDFSLAGSPGSINVKAGSNATYTLTATPVGGAFNSAIKLSCSGAPTGATCNLSSTSVTPGASAANVTLTLSTSRASSAKMISSIGKSHLEFAVWIQFSGFSVFGMLVMRSRRWRKWCSRLIVVALLGPVLLLMSACAGGTGIVPTGGTPPGTYTITAKGVSGSLQHSVTVTLIVQ